jgi:hypothetical protein
VDGFLAEPRKNQIDMHKAGNPLLLPPFVSNRCETAGFFFYPAILKTPATCGRYAWQPERNARQ